MLHDLWLALQGSTGCALDWCQLDYCGMLDMCPIALLMAARGLLPWKGGVLLHLWAMIWLGNSSDSVQSSANCCLLQLSVLMRARYYAVKSSACSRTVVQCRGLVSA
jgi:hypothetical protein